MADCEDCPPVGYPTDKTRCSECPRRTNVMADNELAVLAWTAGLRESIVHGLRSKGWSRIDAENEADDRIGRARSRIPTPPRIEDQGHDR